MTAIPSRVTHAMITQLDRVNSARSAEEDLRAQLREAEAELAAARRKIGELELLLEAYGVVEATVDAPRGAQYGNRPTISARQAAERAGVSLATVTRYVESGHWEGIKPRRGLHGLLVYADQPLMSKGTQRRKSRRNKR